MATSGPITYLVMADQFLSVAARLKRLPQTTATSSPLIGMGGPLAGVSVLGGVPSEVHRDRLTGRERLLDVLERVELTGGKLLACRSASGDARSVRAESPTGRHAPRRSASARPAGGMWPGARRLR